jgi:hypothetical protein
VLKTRLESQMSRMNCQTFSTGLRSWQLGGSGTRVMFGGTMSLSDRCQHGLVEEEHGVSTRRHGHRELGQMRVHRRDVAAGQDKGCALAVLGADGAEDIGRGGALIVRRGGARTWPSADLVLLSDTGLVGKPDLYRGRIDLLVGSSAAIRPSPNGGQRWTG